jgi:hypothetical protein
LVFIFNYCLWCRDYGLRQIWNFAKFGSTWESMVAWTRCLYVFLYSYCFAWTICHPSFLSLHVFTCIFLMTDTEGAA